MCEGEDGQVEDEEEIKNMQQLDVLMGFVAKHFPFIEEKYPELRGKDEQEQLVFALRHLALHISKTAGKIAASSEDVDHGNGVNVQELRVNATKGIVTLLRLADVIGLKGEDLVKAMEEQFQDRLEPGFEGLKD